MNLLKQLKLSVEIGEPSGHLNLSWFPVLTRCAVVTPGYRLLDEALSLQSLIITEVSDQGTVPELALTNNGDLPVLLLDGEELIGAKQNRVVNLTVLAPAGITIRIPVSCVEAGRWAYESLSFRSAPHAQYARGRSSRIAQVSACLRRTGERHSDQSAVWEEIALKSERMGSRSPTSAMRDIFEDYAFKVERYVPHFNASGGQCGAVFAIAGEVVGMDIFDCPATLSKVLPKLVRSYALDAIEAKETQEKSASREDVDAFIDHVGSAGHTTAKAIGLGSDIRLDSQVVAGGALDAFGRIVHLCAFRVGAGPLRIRPARMDRSSRRGRN